MTQVQELLEVELGLSPSLQIQIFKTIIIIIALAIIYRVIRKVLYKTISDTKTYYRVKKASGYLFIILGFILVGRVWFMGIQSLTTFLGLFSAGLAIAMKDLIMNIAGWAYIVWKGPFNVGDRIEIGGTSGDVIDVQLFQFALFEIRNWVEADQSTGRIVYIPNSAVFDEELFNYSKGIPYVWEEIPIYVTYESNWKKAKAILLEIAIKNGESISEEAEASIKEASRKFMIYNAKLDPIVYTSVDNKNCITLTIRYLCGYRNRRDSTEKVYEEVLEKFLNEPDIEFAYPTERVYDRNREKNKIFD